MITRHTFIRRTAAFFLTFMAACLLAPLSSCAEAADVIHVHDGDTFVANASGLTYKVRVWAVDAPEVGQPGCAAARDATREFLRDTHVDILSRGESYGRVVGKVTTAKGDLAEMLLREGLVMLDQRYSKSLVYLKAQREAQIDQRGLWGTNATPPWVWRKQHSSRGKVCQ